MIITKRKINTTIQWFSQGKNLIKELDIGENFDEMQTTLCTICRDDNTLLSQISTMYTEFWWLVGNEQLLILYSLQNIVCAPATTKL